VYSLPVSYRRWLRASKRFYSGGTRTMRSLSPSISPAMPGKKSSSPSIQVKQNYLEAASGNALAAYERGNGEIAVIFRPELFVEYLQEGANLHGQSEATEGFVNSLNSVEKLTPAEIAAIGNPERRVIIATIRRKVREADFRARVLDAYD
jgi:hypothetical protein